MLFGADLQTWRMQVELMRTRGNTEETVAPNCESGRGGGMLIIGYGTLTAPFQSRKRAQTIDGAAASKWPSDRCLSHACRDVAPSDLLGQNKKPSERTTEFKV